MNDICGSCGGYMISPEDGGCAYGENYKACPYWRDQLQKEIDAIRKSQEEHGVM